MSYKNFADIVSAIDVKVPVKAGRRVSDSVSVDVRNGRAKVRGKVSKLPKGDRVAKRAPAAKVKDGNDGAIVSRKFATADSARRSVVVDGRRSAALRRVVRDSRLKIAGVADAARPAGRLVRDSRFRRPAGRPIVDSKARAAAIRRRVVDAAKSGWGPLQGNSGREGFTKHYDAPVESIDITKKGDKYVMYINPASILSKDLKDYLGQYYASTEQEAKKRADAIAKRLIMLHKELKDGHVKDDVKVASKRKVVSDAYKAALARVRKVRDSKTEVKK